MNKLHKEIKQIGVRIFRDDWQKLKNLSEKSELSVSHWIRIIIGKYFEKKRGQGENEE